MAALSPYIRERIKRFGEYATDGLIDPPDAFDPTTSILSPGRSPRQHERRLIPAVGSASRFESSSARCLPNDFSSRSGPAVSGSPIGAMESAACSPKEKPRDVPGMV